MKLSWASLVVGVVSVAACSSSSTTGPSARPAAVVLSPANPWVKSGTSLQLSATVLDSNGAAIAGRPVTFLSSDASIIAVTTGGLATAVGPLGRAAVLARTVFGRDT